MDYLRWGSVTLPILFVSGCFVPVTSESSACVVCRLFRATTSYALVPVTRHHGTECSRWYAAHVEPTHAHVWERTTCVYESDLWGFARSVGCRPGHYPIHLLPSDTQMQVYQHFRNPLAAKALFAGLTDAKTHDDRLDENDEDKGHLTVRAIGAWAAADFPGTWDQWWARWYADHVAEHKDWLEWFRSRDDLNFGEWREKRMTALPR